MTGYTRWKEGIMGQWAIYEDAIKSGVISVELFTELLAKHKYLVDRFSTLSKNATCAISLLEESR